MMRSMKSAYSRRRRGGELQLSASEMLGGVCQTDRRISSPDSRRRFMPVVPLFTAGAVIVGPGDAGAEVLHPHFREQLERHVHRRVFFEMKPLTDAELLA